MILLRQEEWSYLLEFLVVLDAQCLRDLFHKENKNNCKTDIQFYIKVVCTSSSPHGKYRTDET